MLSHALRTAPAECVGVLSGPVTAGPPPSLRDCHPLTNLAPRQDRFLADPVEQITLGKQLRAQGARILAIYHSHPHGSGIPSRTDLQEHNHPGLLQLIIAMGIPGRLELRGYRYTPDRQAIPQRLVIVPAVPSG
jgi:proteasome lid subunit RPN8/RPN11